MIAQYRQRTKTVQADKGVYYYGPFSPLLYREKGLILQNIDDCMAAAIEEMMFLLEMKHADLSWKLLCHSFLVLLSSCSSTSVFRENLKGNLKVDRANVIFS